MPAPPHPPTPAWRTSSHSGTQDHSECLQLADLGDSTIAIGNSNHPSAGIIRFTTTALRAWITGIKAGEFDDLL